MLREVKAYFTQAKTASMAELCQVLNADADTIRGFLSHWIRKGRLHKVSGCGQACTGCQPLSLERYQWLDAEVSLLNT